MQGMFSFDNVARFEPIRASEWIFFIVSILSAILAFGFINRIYCLPVSMVPALVISYITGLCISFIPVQAIAYFYEDRELWLPGNHSAIIFWGDGIGLPLIAAGFTYLRRRLCLTRPLADDLKWRLFVMIGAITISLLYHLHQTEVWSESVLHLPSKDWHDFAVYPIFLYFLASQIPFLVSAIQPRVWGIPSGRITLAIGICITIGGFLFWWWAGAVYDPAHIHNQPLFGFA
jgi:hypothetical protein